IFRGRNFDTTPDIQLLYGSPVLEAYTPPFGTVSGKWQLVDNHMPAGRKNPLFGPPGFGNPYNNYTWAMTVWDNRLWIGTMDWSQGASEGTNLLYKLGNAPVPIEISTFFAGMNFGGDLYFFQDTVTPAVPENNTGIGNSLSFGIRNMLV